MLRKKLFTLFSRSKKCWQALLACSVAIFFLFNASCTVVSSQKVEVNGEEIEMQDDSSDASCSYFYFLWGKFAEAEEKYEEALEAYEKALVCDEKADYLNTKLAVLLINMGKKEQAIVQLEKMIVADPHNLENRTLLGNIYSSMGQLAKAKHVYEETLRVAPDDPHTLMMLGALHAREKDYAAAQNALEKLVSVDQTSYAGFAYLAKLYREMNFYEKALAAYEKALALNWTPLLAYETADLYEYKKKYDGAIKIYQRLLEEDEANVKIRGRLSRLLLEEGKVEEALDELDELKNYTDDPFTVDFAIGRVLLDEKRYEEAIALFTDMLGNEDSRDTARSMLALSYYEAGQIDKAKEILSQVPSSSTDYERSVVMFVQILVEEEKIDEATVFLQSLIADGNVRRPSFYFLLAGLQKDRGDFRAGISVYEQAVKDFAGDHKIWFEYGLYLDQIGKTEEAIIKMQQVLVLNPDDPYALNYIGYSWADQGIRLDQALDYVIRAVEMKPEDGFVRDSLGWVYFKMGKNDLAVKELEQAVAMQPEDPTINEHLGDAYRQAGEAEKAVLSYENAVNYYTDDSKKAYVLFKLKTLQKQLETDN